MLVTILGHNYSVNKFDDLLKVIRIKLYEFSYNDINIQKELKSNYSGIAHSLLFKSI